MSQCGGECVSIEEREVSQCGGEQGESVWRRAR